MEYSGDKVQINNNKKNMERNGFLDLYYLINHLLHDESKRPGLVQEVGVIIEDNLNFIVLLG